MSSDDKQNDWSQDPSLSGIDFARLQALQQMASQSRGKSQAEMMPFLFSLMQGNQGGAQFSASEADLIISAIKAGKSKQEAADGTPLPLRCFREKMLKNYKPKNAAGLESQTGQRFYSVLFPA